MNVTGTALDDWDGRLGSFPVRASCPYCGEDLVYDRKFGVGRCPQCDTTVTICGNRFGFKVCCRELGHAGRHLSPSGTGWAKVKDLRR